MLRRSDKVLRRMVMTRLHHAGCARFSMIAVIPSRGRTRSRNVLSAGIWFTASSALSPSRVATLYGGQTELDPPAEELMRRQTPATRNTRLFLLLHHRSLLLVGEALTVRPSPGPCSVKRYLQRAQLAALLNAPGHFG